MFRKTFRKSPSALVAGLVSTGMAFCLISATSSAQDAGFEPSVDDFSCIRDMEPVRGFFVTNLLGDIEATLEVANSEIGGTYPTGSLIQLVPTEAMIKREPGYNPQTNDWEFFELDVSNGETHIRVRGSDEVVNQFGGNCLECHARAEPQWDMVCEQDHGCDPLPLTPAMLSAIQKTDPRCEATELTEEEAQALQFLAAIRAASEN
ncbi:hypothetical protein [Ponticaulis koreensis]|uniref:hypothetical protein n=1 Tax=Ponticaulis koreensis TaxID=1123045 RepID=UPI000527959F|nr:hypothetical protein [Ponticaulis koreensis]